MNIEISIVLWTVICFFALLFILHNLLFKIMFKHLDERNKRILNAKEKKKSDEKYLLELAYKSEIAAKEFKQKLKVETERKVAEEQTASEHELETLKMEEQTKTEEYILKLAKEKTILASQISDDSHRLTEVFIAGFVS